MDIFKQYKLHVPPKWAEFDNGHAPPTRVTDVMREMRFRPDDGGTAGGGVHDGAQTTVKKRRFIQELKAYVNQEEQRAETERHAQSRAGALAKLKQRAFEQRHRRFMQSSSFAKFSPEIVQKLSASVPELMESVAKVCDRSVEVQQHQQKAEAATATATITNASFPTVNTNDNSDNKKKPSPGNNNKQIKNQKTSDERHKKASELVQRNLNRIASRCDNHNKKIETVVNRKLALEHEKQLSALELEEKLKNTSARANSTTSANVSSSGGAGGTSAVLQRLDHIRKQQDQIVAHRSAELEALIKERDARALDGYSGAASVPPNATQALLERRGDADIIEKLEHRKAEAQDKRAQITEQKELEAMRNAEKRSKADDRREMLRQEKLAMAMEKKERRETQVIHNSNDLHRKRHEKIAERESARGTRYSEIEEAKKRQRNELLEKAATDQTRGLSYISKKETELRKRAEEIEAKTLAQQHAAEKAAAHAVAQKVDRARAHTEHLGDVIARREESDALQRETIAMQNEEHENKLKQLKQQRKLQLARDAAMRHEKMEENFRKQEQHRAEHEHRRMEVVEKQLNHVKSVEEKVAEYKRERERNQVTRRHEKDHYFMSRYERARERQHIAESNIENNIQKEEERALERFCEIRAEKKQRRAERDELEMLTRQKVESALDAQQKRREDGFVRSEEQRQKALEKRTNKIVTTVTRLHEQNERAHALAQERAETALEMRFEKVAGRPMLLDSPSRVQRAYTSMK
eukprot:PhM_4_TR18681/c0_g1_i1/m.46314